MAKAKRKTNGSVTRSEVVRKVMEEKKLSKERTAKMVKVSPHTVTAWLRNPTNKSHREPAMSIVQLLCLKTGTRMPAHVV